MSGPIIGPKGIERIIAIQSEINTGTWDADKKDLALIRDAFEALANGSLGLQANLVQELSKNIAAKVVTDLEWPWIRKVASAVYRIFSGGISLPHALLHTMTETEIELVVEGLHEKMEEIQAGRTLSERRQNELEPPNGPDEKIKFSISNLDKIASDLEKLRDQLGDVATDVINKFGDEAACLEEIGSLDSDLQLALDQTIYEKLKKEFDDIWEAYPSKQETVTRVSFNGARPTRRYVKNPTRDKKLRDLYAKVITQTTGWTEDKYPKLNTDKSPLVLCKLLKNSINESIEKCERIFLIGAK